VVEKEEMRIRNLGRVVAILAIVLMLAGPAFSQFMVTPMIMELTPRSRQRIETILQIDPVPLAEEVKAAIAAAAGEVGLPHLRLPAMADNPFKECKARSSSSTVSVSMLFPSTKPSSSSRWRRIEPRCSSDSEK